MEWQQMLDTFARMPSAQRQSWVNGAAGLVVFMLVLLWLESRFFKRTGRRGSWLAVRLVSLLAAMLALTVLIVPALAVGGPEALGIFLLMLCTGAPLVWFGSHILAGRMVRPRLTQPESLVLAVTGLAILSVPGVAFVAMEGPLYAAAREIGERREVPPDNPPLLHAVQPVQRYNLPDAGLIYTQSLLGAPDTRLVRVELRQGGMWPKDQSMAHPVYCTNGNDVHMMWSAKERPPYLRIHWAQSNGAIVRSEFTPALAFDGAPTPQDFTIGFRADGVDPIAPIPRARAYLVLAKAGVESLTQLLGSPPDGGEVRTTDCVMAGFKRVANNDDWQVQAIGLMFDPSTGGPSLRSLIEKRR